MCLFSGWVTKSRTFSRGTRDVLVCCSLARARRVPPEQRAEAGGAAARRRDPAGRDHFSGSSRPTEWTPLRRESDRVRSRPGAFATRPAGPAGRRRSRGRAPAGRAGWSARGSGRRRSTCRSLPVHAVAFDRTLPRGGHARVAKAALERIAAELAPELGPARGVRVDVVRFSPYSASRAGAGAAVAFRALRRSRAWEVVLER